MPPKPKVTKEMIIDAAYEIVRESGERALNTRNVAGRLNCSTQPVLYAFKTMDQIREGVYEKALSYHSSYIMQVGAEESDPIGAIWKNYIKFSAEEKSLFCLLYHSDAFKSRAQTLIDGEDFQPIMQAIGAQSGIALPLVERFFKAQYYCVHGIASLIASGSVSYEKEELEAVVDLVSKGALREISLPANNEPEG